MADCNNVLTSLFHDKIRQRQNQNILNMANKQIMFRHRHKKEIDIGKIASKKAFSSKTA